MTTVVFDSSAVLAHLMGEQGGRAVRKLLEAARRRKIRAYLSAANLAEVVYVVALTRGEAGLKGFVQRLDQPRLTIEPLSREDAFSAGRLRSRYRMPYGDCFATALALRLGAEVVTKDRDFERVRDLVPIRWI